MIKIAVINGANLNFLGIRQPQIYGNATYLDLKKFLKKSAEQMQIEIEIVQSNLEGELINYLQKYYERNFNAIILNAGAFTHYSYAIYDAILSINIPVIEVHISNIYNRDEDFRHKSVISKACVGSIAGFGFDSYYLAMQFIKRNIL